MSDIKLFRIGNEVKEIEGTSMAIEKSLQHLLEQHLEIFLGVRFLASEYSTGPTHGGRIDTLGIDENNCPVIIEYKRAMNENVINQGLYYLDWLMDHQAEFKLLVMEYYGSEMAKDIEWSSPRLLCIAGDFNKYDEHAVQQINRNIELIRYKRYGKELLMLDLINATTTKSDGATANTGNIKVYKSPDQNLQGVDQEIKDLYESIKSFLTALGDDVQVKILKHYIAFKRLRNFVTMTIQPQARSITMWLKLNPDEVELNDGFTRDVRNIGHHGTGDLEVTIRSMEDFEKSKNLLTKSYEGS
ncbi:DUF91 domain-containing protein [Salipaludibacillus agaradhaerens]|jgi:predicted transport protein|uniref:DUF5655 domain-containing protein n=1 Tax=Salipaludibacillus agaradhaerens TaxID=76935 RepID=UPI00215072CE|nr:DUF5655 domain-containing protein [Salipaludibacillus agaradhaerens]MCR6106873.1 DUF91 domain-containing protein [Salipaludibacillus agaradhaerens]MCR6118905.1 DUF91 domain-containing protein [Salipaludibacillus agaradhaerens]